MFRYLCFAITAMMLVGCGRQYESASISSGAATPNIHDSYAAEETALAESQKLYFASAVGGEGTAPPPNAPSAFASRKIIYSASLNLVVENFSQLEKEIAKLVKGKGGFIAVFREDRASGSQLGGNWTIRIPAVSFDSFVEAAVDLGIVESRQISSQDVTEEFVDLEAQLKNKRHLEERMLELLKDRTGDIKDVIEVESQLGRIREAIERIEGRLRYLKDRTALTTVEIHAREERNYQPPKAPTFGAKTNTVFFNSLENISLLGQSLALFAVGASPWLLLGCLIFGPVGLVWRRRKKTGP